MSYTKTENQQHPDISALTELMSRLRHPVSGCSWDLEQTHESLVPLTVEELSELADAIAKGDSANTCEELGDVLFHLIFYARIAEESGDFSLQDVIDGCVDKMTRRHPHIFAGKVYANAAQQAADWLRIKAEEKALLPPPTYQHLGALKKVDHLQAIAQSMAMQTEMAKLGFDWKNAEDVFEKIDEEVAEVRVEIANNEQEKIAEEYGDLLFAVLNLGRKLELDPEMVLRKANHKFYMRSEAMIAQAGNVEVFSRHTLKEQEALWSAVKETLKTQ